MAPTINVQKNASLRNKRSRGAFKASKGSRSKGTQSRVRRNYGYKKPAQRRKAAPRAVVSKPAQLFIKSQTSPITCPPAKIPDGGTSESLAVKSTGSGVFVFPPNVSGNSALRIFFSTSPQCPAVIQLYNDDLGTYTYAYAFGSAKALVETAVQYRAVSAGWNLCYTGNTVANAGVIRVWRGAGQRSHGAANTFGNTTPSVIDGAGINDILTAFNPTNFQNQADSRVFSVAEITGGVSGIAQHHKGQFDFDGSTVAATSLTMENREPMEISDSQWTMTVIEIKGCAAGAPFYLKAAVNIEMVVGTYSNVAVPGIDSSIGTLQTDGLTREDLALRIAKIDQQANDAASLSNQNHGMVL